MGGLQMNDKIVAFKGKGEVNDDLVDKLEGLLVKAKTGELQALAYVAARRDGAQIVGWTATPKGTGTVLGCGIMRLPTKFALHIENEWDLTDNDLGDT